jgi:hypothetical protein
MRTVEAFILGTITGTVVTLLWGRELQGWGRELQGSVQGKTREVRAKAAEGIRAVETRTGTVLRAAEAAIRPASASGDA